MDKPVITLQCHPCHPKTSKNSLLINWHGILLQSHIYMWLAQLLHVNSLTKNAVVSKFITVHHRATSPLSACLWLSHILQHMRPVLWSVLKSELVSSILKPVIAMGWGQWFVGGVYYRPRSGREGSEECACVCVWGIGQGALSLSVYSQ